MNKLDPAKYGQIMKPNENCYVYRHGRSENIIREQKERGEV